MAYNFVADSFHTIKHFVANFIQSKCDFKIKTAVLRVGASIYDNSEAVRANIGSKSAISLQRMIHETMRAV